MGLVSGGGKKTSVLKVRSKKESLLVAPTAYNFWRTTMPLPPAAAGLSGCPPSVVQHTMMSLQPNCSSADREAHVSDILVGTLHSLSLAFTSTDLSVTHSNSVSMSAKVFGRLRSNSCLLVVLFIHPIMIIKSTHFHQPVWRPCVLPLRLTKQSWCPWHNQSDWLWSRGSTANNQSDHWAIDSWMLCVFVPFGKPRPQVLGALLISQSELIFQELKRGNFMVFS